MVDRALILAAGAGMRLGASADGRPKALLRFGGRTLLRRHLEILAACGIGEVVIAVGYRADLIRREVAETGPPCNVATVENPRFADGSVVSLWSLREALTRGGPVLLMDADVLYDRRMIDRLLAGRHATTMLLDRAIEPGDEPVKICVARGRIVEFRKIVAVDHDFHGESVGFFRLSESAARELADRAGRYVDSGRVDQPYEEAIRDAVLAAPDSAGYEDVTGLPWIEIDFAADVARAEAEILPLLQD